MMMQKQSIFRPTEVYASHLTTPFLLCANAHTRDTFCAIDTRAVLSLGCSPEDMILLPELFKHDRNVIQSQKQPASSIGSWGKLLKHLCTEEMWVKIRKIKEGKDRTLRILCKAKIVMVGKASLISLRTPSVPVCACMHMLVDH